MLVRVPGTPASTTTVGGDYDELDLYAEVSKDFGWANLAVGYIWYDYPMGNQLG